MLNSIFPQSPLFVIESLLSKFEADSISFEDFLQSIERQFVKVETWLERLENLDTADCPFVVEVKELGLEGTGKMMESLEIIHEAASEENFDEVEEEIRGLIEAHRLVVESFVMSRDTQMKYAESVAESVGDFMT